MPIAISNTDQPAFKYLKISWPHEHVAELALARQPVNAFTLEVWEELERGIIYVERLFPHRARGLVLASVLTRPVFSAGFQINQLHAPSTAKERFTAFWLASVRALTRLYTSPLVTVAALRGACYTGGCMLALCCDVRVSEPDLVIGLSESALGIPVPDYWAQLFLSLASNRPEAERALLTGNMLDANQALGISLVDRVVQSNVRDHAAEHAMKLSKSSNPLGRAKTKHNIRNQWAIDWRAKAPEEARLAWADLSSEQSVADIGRVLKQLRQSKL